MLLYLKSHGRRPVWLGPPGEMFDLGDRIPLGWCERCGCELYAEGKVYCAECAQAVRKERNEDVLDKV